MIRSIYIPDGVAKLIDEAARKLGMSHSRFIQYCVLHVLGEINMLTAKVHEEDSENGVYPW
ncbi:MAG: hypothetical protein QXU09_04300 [Thermoproteota archaeon]|nr:hypothetical protein [Candidatus Bathyarchaeota archaeon]